MEPTSYPDDKPREGFGDSRGVTLPRRRLLGVRPPKTGRMRWATIGGGGESSHSQRRGRLKRESLPELGLPNK